jgi:RNA polymerase sigma-70 factor (ECF subfamily)
MGGTSVSLVHIDDELVDGVRERSEEAFATVYQLLASDLLSYAVSMLRDRGAAEDAVQQAFLELARAAPTMRGDGRSLRAWLYRSVRYSCLDEIRRRHRHPERPSDTVPDSTESLEPSFPDPDLAAALMRLGERQREILVLRYVLGATVEDIGRILGTNRGAVYAASARAERKLRALLSSVESGSLAASPATRDP